MAQEPKVKAYFEGEAFWTAFDAQRAKYAGPDAQFRILTKGNKYYVQFCGPKVDGKYADGGDPINDSHLCPGSPGCP